MPRSRTSRLTLDFRQAYRIGEVGTRQAGLRAQMTHPGHWVHDSQQVLAAWDDVHEVLAV
jgi:hypothetical protein